MLCIFFIKLLTADVGLHKMKFDRMIDNHEQEKQTQMKRSKFVSHSQQYFFFLRFAMFHECIHVEIIQKNHVLQKFYVRCIHIHVMTEFSVECSHRISMQNTMRFFSNRITYNTHLDISLCSLSHFSNTLSIDIVWKMFVCSLL